MIKEYIVSAILMGPIGMMAGGLLADGEEAPTPTQSCAAELDMDEDMDSQGRDIIVITSDEDVVVFDCAVVYCDIITVPTEDDSLR